MKFVIGKDVWELKSHNANLYDVYRNEELVQSSLPAVVAYHTILKAYQV
jgi:hypothetical protein